MDKQDIQRIAVARAFKQHGSGLPDAPTSPILERFVPEQLAWAIEQELEHAALIGWTKISIHLDLLEAALLARFLRGVR